jgi:chromatin segregation and condensation protein Rec8/ScpA/Scc1 (kleisin family)
VHSSREQSLSMLLNVQRENKEPSKVSFIPAKLKKKQLPTPAYVDKRTKLKERNKRRRAKKKKDELGAQPEHNTPSQPQTLPQQNQHPPPQAEFQAQLHNSQPQLQTQHAPPSQHTQFITLQKHHSVNPHKSSSQNFSSHHHQLLPHHCYEPPYSLTNYIINHHYNITLHIITNHHIITNP